MIIDGFSGNYLCFREEMQFMNQLLNIFVSPKKMTHEIIHPKHFETDFNIDAHHLMQFMDFITILALQFMYFIIIFISLG